LVKVIVRIVVSGAVLWFVLRSIDVSSLWDRVQAMNPLWLLLAIAVYVGITMVGVWRWHRLLHAQHIDIRWQKLSDSTWVSLFFNNFLPSNIGGDVVRISDTAPAAGSKTLATTVILVDRVLGLTALLCVATLGALLGSFRGVHVPGARWLWIVAAGGVAAAVPVVLVPQLVPLLLSPLRALKRPWVDERAQRLEDAVVKFRAAPSALVSAFGGAVIVQGGIVVYYLLCARGLSIPLPVFLGAVLIPVSLVIQMVPVSIGGFGVREAVFAYFFKRFGLPPDAGVALSLVSTGVIMAVSMFGGIRFLSRKSR